MPGIADRSRTEHSRLDVPAEVDRPLNGLTVLARSTEIMYARLEPGLAVSAKASIDWSTVMSLRSKASVSGLALSTP